MLESLNRAWAEVIAKRKEDAERRALVLEMGRIIRGLDGDHEYLEFWTQDGDYVLDGRFGLFNKK